MTMPPLKLRPYQEEALRISKQKLDAGVTRQMLALPTGTGKTCIFASLLEYYKFQGNMLVLVHRSELADQAYEKIRAWNPDLPLRRVGIEMGLDRCTGWEKVVIAGVQTVGRTNTERLQKFPPSWFDVIVCDEAHHSVSPTYRNVFEHFGLFNRDNKKLLMGVTATPYRADDKELIPAVYQEIILNMPMLQAIDEGWLCDVRGFRITETGANLDSVNTGDDDFAVDRLDNEVNNAWRNGLIAREWRKLALNRRTIVFAVTVKHAIQLAAAFGEYCGVKAEAVWGEDPERERKLKEHKGGKVQILCNCGVLTEGYDDWGIECIVMARPTLSKVLFVQMIGRGTRVERFPDDTDNLVEARRKCLPITKPDCLIIDVVDNTKKHDLVTLASLFNRGMDFDGKSLTELAKQKKQGEIASPYLTPTDVQKVERIETSIEEVDLFKGGRRVEKPTTREVFKQKWEKMKRDQHFWLVISTAPGATDKWKLEESEPSQASAERKAGLLRTSHPNRAYSVCHVRDFAQLFKDGFIDY
jgi:superfamily II DNA or RNA helicase